ncbi:MAG: DUF1499 domain-containing protein [Gammaproteobacteria bacterium]|nr:DUF1499 domain-containing protein [Gammaproteobacteria bacterium]
MTSQPKGTRLSRIGCWAALIGAVLIIASGARKAGLVDNWMAVFLALGLGGLLLMIALLTAGLGLIRSGGTAGAASRRGTWLAFLAGLAMTLFNLNAMRGMGGPPIHDVTTDTINPPMFVDAIPLREADGAQNPPMYFPAEVVEAQKAAYPDLQTIVVSTPANDVFQQAQDIARDLGWEVIAVVPEDGRIEAVASTRWIAFRDDVVIRIINAGTETRVDLRSKSRVGRGDAGENAKRIRAFRDRLTAS